MSTKFRILHFIYNSIQTNHYSPTVREIGEAVGLSSTSSVQTHIRNLKNQGYLYREGSGPRMLVITEKGKERALLGVQHQIPVYITDGAKKVASFPVLPDMNVMSNQYFMFVIPDESMKNIGILCGDKVIVRKQGEICSGDLVVVLIGKNKLICGNLFKDQGKRTYLQFANEEVEPLYLQECRVLGKVIGLYRDFF